MQFDLKFETIGKKGGGPQNVELGGEGGETSKC